MQNSVAKTFFWWGSAAVAVVVALSVFLLFANSQNAALRQLEIRNRNFNESESRTYAALETTYMMTIKKLSICMDPTCPTMPYLEAELESIRSQRVRDNGDDSNGFKSMENHIRDMETLPIEGQKSKILPQNRQVNDLITPEQMLKDIHSHDMESMILQKIEKCKNGVCSAALTYANVAHCLNLYMCKMDVLAQRHCQIRNQSYVPLAILPKFNEAQVGLSIYNEGTPNQSAGQDSNSALIEGGSCDTFLSIGDIVPADVFQQLKGYRTRFAERFVLLSSKDNLEEIKSSNETYADFPITMA